MFHTPVSLIDKRSIGVLAHLSSLPSDFGVGTLGKDSRKFIDFLNACGFSYWQMCPVGPTGYGDSPYQSFSTFAGNPYFLDLEEFVENNLVDEELLAPFRSLSNTVTDYGALYRLHNTLLLKIYRNVSKSEDGSIKKGFSTFTKKNNSWLLPYCTFRAFKDYFGQTPWWEWPAECRTFAKAVKTSLYKDLSMDIEFHKFFQFVFFRQWKSLHEYAESKGVRLIGDVPIFAALDSADVWLRPDIFKLDKEGRPTHFSGVPPDYFSELGQSWGNPLYYWQKERAGCFAWWMERLKHHFELFDVLRLDHFRGFESYWSIPAGAPDARTGKWMKGPGIEFFKKIKKEIPDAKLIAEDLGIITDEVRELLKETGLPGMAVLQFAFDNHPDNTSLPHNLNKNTILYAGTHDNNTTRGWYGALSEQDKDQVRRYFRVSGDAIAWDFIHALYESTADLAMVTMQDLLNKGSEARLNLPGTALGNWQWRFTRDELEGLQANSSAYLRELKWLYGR